MCSGYSGAQLANLVNMAATVASQRGSEQICQQDIEKARFAVFFFFFSFLCWGG